MKPGSVIVDMAAANGGNVEGTVAGEVVVTANGVTIIGYTDLAGRLRRAGLAAVRHQPGQPDEADDPGQGRRARPGLGRRRAARRSRWRATARSPGRRPRCRSPRAPAAAAAAPVAKVAASRPPSTGPAVRDSSASAAALLLLLVAAAPAALRVHLTVFALAIVIGYYVIGNVHHALHTPLMSVTNAISGIIVVGALLQIGHGDTDDHRAVVRRDPARQHQRVRRFRRDPPHALHVLQELSPP